MEFTEKEWKKISNYCKKKKIIFLSSPFSLKAVKLLKKNKYTSLENSIW